MFMGVSDLSPDGDGTWSHDVLVPVSFGLIPRDPYITVLTNDVNGWGPAMAVDRLCDIGAEWGPEASCRIELGVLSVGPENALG